MRKLQTVFLAVLFVFVFSGCQTLLRFTDTIGNTFGKTVVKADYCGIPQDGRDQFNASVDEGMAKQWVKEENPPPPPTYSGVNCP